MRVRALLPWLFLLSKLSNMEQRKVCIKCGRKRIAERMEMFGTIDGVTHWVCRRREFNWRRSFSSTVDKCNPLPGSLYARYKNLVTVLIQSFEKTGDPVDVLPGKNGVGVGRPGQDKAATG